MKLCFKDTIFEEGICAIVQTFHVAMKEHLEECKPYLKEFAIRIAKGSANISRMRFLSTEDGHNALTCLQKMCCVILQK